MQDLRGRSALLTGAAGGLGGHIARALAAEGVDLVLSGRNGAALEALRDQLESSGVRREIVIADLADRADLDALPQRAADALGGPPDILVNNAGIEITAHFGDLTTDEIESVIHVNLLAPLLLAHAVVPGMLQRGRGHVVFIASLAGKYGPACSEPYAASKAGLIRVTQSLRSEYAGEPVGFSAVSPGFVADDGMYGRMQAEGLRASALAGESRPEKVGAAVVSAIRSDRPDVIVNPRPMRPLLAIGELAPRLVERLVRRAGVDDLFRAIADRRAQP